MSDPPRFVASPRIGLLGGTFDPIHLAHLVVAQEVAARLDLHQVLFIPANEPPHKRGRPITPGHQRRAMVELAIADEPRFALCTIELERDGPSYTADTVAQLRASYGSNAQIFFILGADMLGTFAHWHAPGDILRQVTGLAAVHRPDFAPLPTARAAWEAQLPGLGAAIIPVPVPQLEISSTEIRERVALHLPIRYLVADAVRDYIEAQSLYRTSHEQGGAA
jgi:nicotinate-nucleotide adenylyltransferase